MTFIVLLSVTQHIIKEILMKTLSKEIRHSFFETYELYQQFRTEWKKTKKHTLMEHIVYAIMRGRDIEKTFTRVSNPKKIANGAEWNSAVLRIGQNLAYISENKPIINECTWRKTGHLETYDVLECFGGVVNHPMFMKAYGHYTNGKEA